MKGEVLGDGNALLLYTDNNVATVLVDLESGDALGEEITVVEDVPFDHKVALESIAEVADVGKYGEVIGCASVAIVPGEWIHTHNCDSNRGRGDLATQEVSDA